MGNEGKELLFHTMNAQDEASGDWADGAWWAGLEDIVTWWNNDKGTDYDPHDTVHEWIEWRKDNE